MAIPEESEDVVRARAESLADNTMHIMGDLWRIRVAHGMSQQDVAECLGIPVEEVAWMETYFNNPTLPQIRRYALAVGARIEVKVIDDRRAE